MTLPSTNPSFEDTSGDPDAPAVIGSIQGISTPSAKLQTSTASEAYHYDNLHQSIPNPSSVRYSRSFPQPLRPTITHGAPPSQCIREYTHSNLLTHETPRPPPPTRIRRQAVGFSGKYENISAQTGDAVRDMVYAAHPCPSHLRLMWLTSVPFLEPGKPLWLVLSAFHSPPIPAPPARHTNSFQSSPVLRTTLLHEYDLPGISFTPHALYHIVSCIFPALISHSNSFVPGYTPKLSNVR